MIRNIAFTFGFVFLSVAMVSQSADAQNYRSGCYCQQPVQVVQTFATPQPVQYYQMIPQQVAQPVTTLYGSVSPAPVFYNSVGVVSQPIYSDFYGAGVSNAISNGIPNAIPIEYPVSQAVPAFVNGIIETPVASGVLQSTYNQPVAVETVQPTTVAQSTTAQPTPAVAQPVAAGESDTATTSPVADTAKEALKVETSTEAPTPAKSILKK